MTRFEPQTSGIVGDCSTYLATTTASKFEFLILQFSCFREGGKFN